MFLLLVLSACHKMRDRVDDLEAVQADQGDEVSALARDLDNEQESDEARLDAAEARLDAAEATILSLAERLADAEAGLEAAEARLVVLEALPVRVDDLDARVGELEERVAATEAHGLALDLGLTVLDEEVGTLTDDLAELEATVAAATSAGSLDHPAAIYSTSEGSGVATSSSWASVTSSTLTFPVESGDTILAWCVAVDGTGYAAYRLSGSSADGSWSASSEALGDGGTTMAYTGEAVTVVGTFAPGVDDDVELTCEGQWASPSDVTVVAMVI